MDCTLETWHPAPPPPLLRLHLPPPKKTALPSLAGCVCTTQGHSDWLRASQVCTFRCVPPGHSRMSRSWSPVANPQVESLWHQTWGL